MHGLQRRGVVMCRRGASTKLPKLPTPDTVPVPCLGPFPGIQRLSRERGLHGALLLHPAATQPPRSHLQRASSTRCLPAQAGPSCACFSHQLGPWRRLTACCPPLVVLAPPSPACVPACCVRVVCGPCCPQGPSARGVRGLAARRRRRRLRAWIARHACLRPTLAIAQCARPRTHHRAPAPPSLPPATLLCR